MLTPSGHEKLDNPVWHSLSETHRRLAIAGATGKFYVPAYCPFGGFAAAEQTVNSIRHYASLVNDFYIVGERPLLPRNVFLKKELICRQMIIERVTGIEPGTGVTRLNENHLGSLLQLINLVQPGYFKSRTFFMGNYYGIFRDGQLVAVTGERMQMDGYTEISAVITHPDYTGKGYAKQLVSHAVAAILANESIPFLHVAATNQGAIRLYQNLGFTTRREISFWHLKA